MRSDKDPGFAESVAFPSELVGRGGNAGSMIGNSILDMFGLTMELAITIIGAAVRGRFTAT
jgi:hypothetical protein